MRSARSARSLLDRCRCAALGEAERNIVGDYFLHAHTGLACTTGLANLVLKKIGRRPQTDGIPRPSLQPPGSNSWLRGRAARPIVSLFLFFFSQPKKRRSASCAIGTEIVPHNEFLAFRRMRTADCDSVSATVVLWLPERHDRRPGESSTGSSDLIPRYCAPPFNSCTYTGSKVSLSRYLS